MTAPRIASPRFVSTQEAIGYHEITLSQYGGASGIRDHGLLESALAQPRQGFTGAYTHQFPFEMAAAYAFHIAKNHPFFDGNKRAALSCCVVFLRMNGFDLLGKSLEAADMIVSLVEGRSTKAEFASWLQERCRERPRLELRDFFVSIEAKAFVESLQASRPDAEGNRVAEFQAAADELATAIPAVNGLLDINRAAVRSGDENTRLTSTAAILTLAAIYRIAEDLGYEW